MIHEGDTFSIDFPIEVELPLDLECDTDDMLKIGRLDCQRSGENTV
jgi:hypothetical protein